MRRALVDMQPDRFEDLIALVALYRPGPMANIPTYCLRKHGREEPDYIHPKLEPILKETYGVIVYQEQVMQIAQDPRRLLARPRPISSAAPWARRSAPRWRRSASASSPAPSARTSTETRPSRSSSCCAKFAEYGFNKAHAGAYALVAYQTAYMKANYPVEFMAASLTLESGNTDKIAEFRREAIRLGIPVEAPSVNRSGVEFDVAEAASSIRWPRSRASARRRSSIWSRCAAQRPFRDLADFGRRINPEAHQQAGAGKPDRRRRARRAGARPGAAHRRRRPHPRHGDAASRRSAAVGQADMFGGGQDARAAAPAGGRAVAGGGEAEARARRGRLLSRPPIRSTNTAPVLQKMRVQTWAEFAESVRNGRDRRPPRRHRHRAAGAAHPHRQPDGRGPALRPDRLVRGGRSSRRGSPSIAICSSPATRSSCWSAPRSGRRASTSASSRSSRSTR